MFSQKFTKANHVANPRLTNEEIEQLFHVMSKEEVLEIDYYISESGSSSDKRADDETDQFMTQTVTILS